MVECCEGIDMSRRLDISHESLVHDSNTHISIRQSLTL